MYNSCYKNTIFSHEKSIIMECLYGFEINVSKWAEKKLRKRNYLVIS